MGGGRVRKNDPRYRGEAGLMSRRSNIHVSVYNIWECRPGAIGKMSVNECYTY